MLRRAPGRARSGPPRTSIAWLLAVLAAIVPAVAWAQTAPSLAGRVSDSRDGSAVVGATVIIEETGGTAVTGEDGRYTFRTIARGTWHLRVTAARFVPGRVEIIVGDSAAVADVPLEPELHYAEVVVGQSEPPGRVRLVSAGDACSRGRSSPWSSRDRSASC